MNFAGVAEWQTHQTQNLTYASMCEFKSHRRQKKVAENKRQKTK